MQTDRCWIRAARREQTSRIARLTCLFSGYTGQGGLFFQLYAKHGFYFVGSGEHTVLVQAGHAAGYLRGLVFPATAEHAPRITADRRQRRFVEKSLAVRLVVVFDHQLVTQAGLVCANAQTGSQAVSPIDVHQHARLQGPSRCRRRMHRALHRVRGYRRTGRSTVWTVQRFESHGIIEPDNWINGTTRRILSDKIKAAGSCPLWSIRNDDRFSL